MVKDVQQIRESQFVLMYGQGSLIESKLGSRLIPEVHHCVGKKYKEVLDNPDFDDDVRMSSVIKNMEEIDENIHLYAMPSTGQSYNSFGNNFRTYIFPTWKICQNIGKHKGQGSILYNAMRPDNPSKLNKCPVCGDESLSNVRFLLACPDGHLDDIDWNYAVHNNNKCKPNYLLWKPRGSSLSEIEIECPDCSRRVTMSDIYKMKFECSGRFPEKQRPKNITEDVTFPDYFDRYNYSDCSKDMKVVQKQSTSLRVVNSLTLLKMPKFDIPIINILKKESYNAFQSKIIWGLFNDHTDFLKAIKDISINDYEEMKDYFDNHDFNKFKVLFFESLEDSKYKEALYEECETLSAEEIKSPNFEKDNFIEYQLNILGKQFPIKVCAINKLKSVTAQISYQRKPIILYDEFGNLLNKRVSSGHRIGKEIWYPAYEGVGEGIFITSDSNPIEFFNLDKLYNIWLPIINNINVGFRDDINDPQFIWWHTLSHAVINSLSLYCGYNSSSLKERVYLHPNGGILIYNTSPGEDSGMGGLSEVANFFDDVLENAIKSIISCSNDPLCIEESIEVGKVNGAACHNCLLISETSCEHRNMLLDRHFFTE